ncbi:hypothetical protein MHK_008875, partial [Candidatus Magnetomorum sp. HK-1]
LQKVLTAKLMTASHKSKTDQLAQSELRVKS